MTSAWSAEGSGGAPILEGAAAVFECFNRSRYTEGDHVIFVGEVEEVPGVFPHGGTMLYSPAGLQGFEQGAGPGR